MTISEEQLKEMQSCILGILKAIDRICIEHNITYYLAAGTMLGAIRHKGFVPWDDDADIAMPRPDYDRFVAHANKWLPAHYRLIDGTKDARYPYAFGRVHDTRTTYLLYRHFDFYSGVPVDIFPIDGICDNKLMQQLHYKRFRWQTKRLYYALVDPYKHGHGLRSAVMRLLQSILNPEKIHKRIDSIQRHYEFDSCHLVADHDFRPKRGIMLKEIYGTPQRIPFADTTLNGVQDPHAYLTHLYGDYMTPVPASRLNFRELDLHHSYLDLVNSE